MASTFAKKAFSNGKSSIKTFTKQVQQGSQAFAAGTGLGRKATLLLSKGALRKLEGNAGIDSYTKLMLHMNDASLIDSSLSPKTVVLHNSITRSATQNKFGGYAAYFDGTAGKYIHVANHADFKFDADFTIDFWMYYTAPNANVALFDCRAGSGGSTTGFVIYSLVDGTIGVYSGGFITGDTIKVSTNTWYHVALARKSGAVKLFINGVQSGPTGNWATNLTDGNCYIGSNFDAFTVILQGYIDELRISKGIARWVYPFVPPTRAYV